jgi:tetratricopeptide (TPR) repeat protein
MKSSGSGFKQPVSDQSFVTGTAGDFDQDGRSVDDVVHALALNGVLQRVENAGLPRRVVVELAKRVKTEEGLGFNQALKEVEHGVEIALGVITWGTHGTFTTEEANVVLAEVAERTASANFDSAVRTLDDALAEIDNLEAKQQEAAHRNHVLFLEAAIKQHTLRRDAVGVVSRIERLVALDHTSDPLTSLRARYNEYLAEGQDKGVNFLLRIAAECARRLIEISGQKERGAALVDLGNALSTLGQRENGVRHLLEAVESYRGALKELTRDRAPLHWAIVQNNLGVVLCTLGEREIGTERLVEAVEACREALKERTREHLPRQWAITQNNLGNALSKIAERERGTEHLLEAVEAYRNALEELAGSPIDRAMTQNNLGNVLSALGERENGTEHLLESVEVYREALKERTRERVPLDWAMTQNNLGNALCVLGQRENSTERLVEAVEVCREALKERTRERAPLYWATTQNNLGTALYALGLRNNNTELLLEAVDVFREALKERTRERVPFDWAMTQNNLGIALWTLGRRGNSSEHLLGAVEAYRESLKERTRERVPLNWARIQHNLGIALSALGRGDSGIGRLHQAIEAYHEALKELTREHTPAEWSNVRSDLVDTQNILNERLGFSHSTPLSFKEPSQRQNFEPVSYVTDYTDPVSGVVTTPDQGQEPPEAQDLSEDDLSTRAAFHAFADEAFERGLSIERFRKAIERELAATKQKAAHETTDRARGEARPEATPSADTSVLMVTREMLGNSVPPSLQTDGRQKYEFAPELFDDPQVIKTEESIANRMKYKIRSKKPIAADERARGNLAKAFLGQLRTRQQQPKNG